MQFDVKQAVAGTLTLAMFIMLLHMISNEHFFSSAPEEVALVADGVEDIADLQGEKLMATETASSPALWGKPGPVLRSCVKKHIAARQGRTWGYVVLLLSNGPQYHPLQVADAAIVARTLGATLLLPKLKDAPDEPNGEFDKIYDVNNFISSLKDVVRVVGRLPEDVRGLKPKVVKVPYRVSAEYIEENVMPIFKQSMIIQLTTVFTGASLKAEDTSTDEEKAIRCLVTHNALHFNSQVKKLGDRIMGRVRESDESSSGRFIAVDLREDVLKQKGCSEAGSAKNKKCFDAQEVGSFLKRLGFPSDTPIYLTQSRWDESLNPLKDMFPNVHTKEYSMPFNEERQIMYSGETQFEKAVDYYICTHSDVFVPAISGLSYVAISGERIAIGKTQILVPTAKGGEKLKISRALSRFVTAKNHPVYSCFCNDSSDTSE